VIIKSATPSFKGTITVPLYIQGVTKLNNIYLGRVPEALRPALRIQLETFGLNFMKLHVYYPQPEMLLHLQQYEEAARLAIFEGDYEWTNDTNFGSAGFELANRALEIKMFANQQRLSGSFRASGGGGGGGGGGGSGNNGGARPPARGFSADRRVPGSNTYCRSFNKSGGCPQLPRGLTCNYPHICSICFSKEHSANTCTQRGDGDGPTDGGVGRRGVSFGAGTKQ